MDATTAKALLRDIKQVKQAAEDPLKTQFSGLAGLLPSFGSKNTELAQQIHQQQNQQLQTDAVKDIFKTLLIAGGVGAAVRGLGGLQDTTTAKKVSPKRVVEMPVPYPAELEEKKASNEDATSQIGLNYYMPSMLIGAPLAAYGGWKGVDALIRSQQRTEEDNRLEEAKQKYEQALLGAYKHATEEALDSAFTGMQKCAEGPAKSQSMVSSLLNSISPNLEGAIQGGLITTGLVSAPLGYMIVNNAMKKNSQKAILQKALAARARRQALQQPPEIYAIPQPQEQEGE
jgi:hypothetical protein